MQLIDAHLHPDPKDPLAISHLLTIMDTHSVRKAMLILNTEAEYEALLKEKDCFLSNRDRFWIASGINIHDLDSFRRFETLGEMGAQPKVKIHPRLFRITKEEIDTVVAAVQRYDVPIIVDSLYYGEEIAYHNGVELGVALAVRYPDRKVVMAHSGSIQFLKCMMATRYLPNVYYDYSFIQSFFQHTSLRLDMVDFLRRTPNRILFGSDYPSFPIDSCLENFLSLFEESGLGREKLGGLLSGNAETVYGVS